MDRGWISQGAASSAGWLCLAVGLCVLVAVPAALAGAGETAETGLDLVSAKASGAAKAATFTLTTRQVFDAGALRTEQGELCVDLAAKHLGRVPDRSLCITPGRGGDLELFARRYHKNGTVRGGRRLHARITRPSTNSVRMRVDSADLGTSAQRLQWAAITRWTDPEGCAAGLPTPTACTSRLPEQGARALHLPPAPTPDCVPRGPAYRHSGPHKREVAFGIDDGPSIYTSRVLRILRRTGSHATFYVIGEQIAGRKGLLRRMIREGHEIGNHSWQHRPGVGLPATSRAIRRATGWSPCTYRPPYGSLAGSGVTRGLGLITVTWNVDPRDWSLPGTGAIVSRVTSGSRPGSIVVMHDGGGNRSQSLAALPRIIKKLHRRGLKVVSVQELLGLTPRG